VKGENGSGTRVRDTVSVWVGDADVWPCTFHSNDRGDVDFLEQYQRLVLIGHNMDGPQHTGAVVSCPKTRCWYV